MLTSLENAVSSILYSTATLTFDPLIPNCDKVHFCPVMRHWCKFEVPQKCVKYSARYRVNNVSGRTHGHTHLLASLSHCCISEFLAPKTTVLYCTVLYCTVLYCIILYGAECDHLSLNTQKIPHILHPEWLFVSPFLPSLKIHNGTKLN